MKNETNVVIKNLNTELKNKFKAKVTLEGTNMTDKIKEWIREYVAHTK